MEAIPVHGAEAGQVDGLKKKKRRTQNGFSDSYNTL